MDRQIELNIIKGVQNGQTEGFSKLYSEYYRYVKFICRSIVNDESISEDLTHDAFIKAIEKIHSFDVNNPNSSFKAFIRVIAYNLSCNFWKRRNMEKNIKKKIAEKVREEDASAEKPPEVLEKNEKKSKLLYALSKLPKSTRPYIIDFHFNGRSYSEICDMYQISKGTLGWKIKRGMEQLRKELRDMEN